MADLDRVTLIDGRFRLVYLQPNPYSEEALVVGVVAEWENQIYLDKINAPDNFQVLGCLFGSEAREQVIFALNLLQESTHKPSCALSEFESPTSILKLGSLVSMSCEDPKQFSRDVLRLSSSLYRNYKTSAMCEIESFAYKKLVKSLRQSIIQLNPFLGREFIKPVRIQTKGGNYIEVPISGPRTIGTPVSLVMKEPGTVKNLGDAVIARLRVAKERLKKDPILYVYVPSAATGIDVSKVQDSLDELQVVGEVCDVTVCAKNSVEELARSLFEFEQYGVSH